ncbi:energy-coupling factor ABC transporter permease [Rheinheimera baltica]|uniref:energy-coupling factor ABC transporter permease n=1 Tax=Rheinheimera baltica TaxID=67576 RepID=UPI00040BAE06|nr:energy-coupling factor ABC transporter permease [Rheinheimera baltica]
MTSWQMAGFLLTVALMLYHYPREFFPKLKQETDYQHLVLASAVALSLFWSIQAGIKEGLNLHFLLVTTLVLSHGWRIAIWICLLPTVLLVGFGKLPWQDSGLFMLISIILPALFSYLLFLASYRYLSRHLFVYIFVAGFIAAALTIVLQISLTSLWFGLEGRYSWTEIIDNYWQLALLIWFPEALLNGSAITLMAIYRPHWLRTFYDREYLAADK